VPAYSTYLCGKGLKEKREECIHILASPRYPHGRHVPDVPQTIAGPLQKDERSTNREITKFRGDTRQSGAQLRAKKSHTSGKHGSEAKKERKVFMYSSYKELRWAFLETFRSFISQCAKCFLLMKQGGS
jgi:hypothetical protein